MLIWFVGFSCMLRSGLALLFLSSELCLLLEIGSFAPIPNMFEFVILRCYVAFFTESWGLCPLLKKKERQTFATCVLLLHLII
jgi:hypothetical protein